MMCIYDRKKSKSLGFPCGR
jgi:hypothetical protein